jgi:hypothetical protein
LGSLNGPSPLSSSFCEWVVVAASASTVVLRRHSPIQRRLGGFLKAF